MTYLFEEIAVCDVSRGATQLRSRKRREAGCVEITIETADTKAMGRAPTRQRDAVVEQSDWRPAEPPSPPRLVRAAPPSRRGHVRDERMSGESGRPARACSHLRRPVSYCSPLQADRSQLTNRRLEASDHAALLDAMRDLETEGIIEFNHARMEKLPRHEQFCMAARTDVMLGVHGNGLSHQLWMLPGAGVIEVSGECRAARR